MSSETISDLKYRSQNSRVVLLLLSAISNLRSEIIRLYSGDSFMVRQILLSVVTLSAVVSFACSKSDFAHTTAVTTVPPPPRQELKVVSKPMPEMTVTARVDSSADPTKPLIIFDLENGKTFRVGEEVPILFAVKNAKLKADGGDFRVRYIVDDEEMKWLDSSQPFSLVGWTPGKHTVRIELIGPDGWPYKNGNANIVTREIEVLK